MNALLPSGTVTFLFSDIEGSTARWERNRDAMSEAVRRHDQISASAIDAAGGIVFKTTGDGCCAVFSRAGAAVAAALTLRDRLAQEPWAADADPLLVRIGIHTGSAEERGGDYFGPTLNRTARLMSAGHGGQILISESTHQLLDQDTVHVRDLGQHRLRDLLRPEHIYQVGDPRERYPPLRTLDEGAGNLPIQVTPFVGREDDLRALTSLVPLHRLVTLTGPGGTGKTRLALQTAAELVDQYEAVYFVGLSRIREPEDVVPAIADAIGLQRQSTANPHDVVLASLATRRCLLLLDNFEHVMPAAAPVGSLLDGAPDVSVLVTSRELLRLRAEQNYPVAPMETPLAPSDATVEELAAVESVRLFVDRARAVRPDFTLDTGNAQDVAAICRRLDGLPLAIELAAARVRLFGPAELRSALTAGLGVLTGGPVDAPQRQRTLLDTVRWSYELLDPTEMSLFRRMAVFVGGRSLEAVAAVCLPGLDSDAITSTTALADKSLIRVRHDSAGETRLDMLETIHGFARAELQASGELAEMQHRHAQYFADVAERAEAELRGSEQTEWMARLEQERPNFEAALEWSLGGNSSLPGLRIVAGLRDFWFYQGHYRVMSQWADPAMALLPDDDPGLQAGVLLTAGFHAYGKYRDDAVDLFDRSAALYEQAGDDAHRALALVWAAGAHEILDADLDAARRCLEEGTALAREVGATHVVAQALNMHGEMERTVGNYELARAIQEEGLSLARQTGEQRRVAMISHNLGLIAHHLGDDTTAERLIRESLALSNEIGFDAQTAHSLIALAEQLTLRDDPDVAARLIGAAEHFFGVSGMKAQPADAPDHDRIRTIVLEELGQDRYAEAVAQGARLDIAAAVELASST